MTVAELPVLLIAEDDPDDQLMVKEALYEAKIPVDTRFVEDGAELLDYLCRQGKYSLPADTPMPNLILLDLNMPRIDGRQALQAIKQDPDLAHIPLVVLTTSRSEEERGRCNKLGANDFITKPASYTELISILENLYQAWLVC